MWQVEGDWASLSAHRFVARVSPCAPREGLFGVRFDEREITDARLMQLRNVDASCEKDTRDLFVRGPDLVVPYSGRATDGLSCQVHWRAIESREPQAVGVEIVVSVQTNLLDADASIVLGNELPCTEVLHLCEDGTQSRVVTDASQRPSSPDADQISQPGLLLYRLADGAGSCVEMVHPTDFLTGQVVGTGAESGLVRSTFTLFGERLEKGVIRRARARTLFLSAEDDEARAVECYRRFAASPSLLTT